MVVAMEQQQFLVFTLSIVCIVYDSMLNISRSASVTAYLNYPILKQHHTILILLIKLE